MKILKPYKGFSLANVTQGYTDLHHAIDSLPVRKGLLAYGTPLVAPEDCVIGKLYGNEYDPNNPHDDRPITNGYGLWMKGASGYEHLYWHCQPVFPVNTGDSVKQGTIVGYVGDSGNVTVGGVYVPISERDHAPFLGTHLHQGAVEERNGQPNKGMPVNPLDLMDLETEPSYTIWDELKAASVTLMKISGLLKQ